MYTNRDFEGVADEQIVGKIIFRVWPLNRFGKVA